MMLVIQKRFWFVTLVMLSFASGNGLLAQKKKFKTPQRKSASSNIYDALKEDVKKAPVKVVEETAPTVLQTIIIQPPHVEAFLEKNGFNLSNEWYNDLEDKKWGEKVSSSTNVFKKPINKIFQTIKENLEKNDIFIRTNNATELRKILKVFGFPLDDKASTEQTLTHKKLKKYKSYLISTDVRAYGLLDALQQAIVGYFDKINIKKRKKAGDEYYASEPRIVIVLQMLSNGAIRVGSLPSVRQDELFPEGNVVETSEKDSTTKSKDMQSTKATSFWGSWNLKSVAKAFFGGLMIAMIAGAPTLAQAQNTTSIQTGSGPTALTKISTYPQATTYLTVPMVTQGQNITALQKGPGSMTTQRVTLPQQSIVKRLGRTMHGQTSVTQKTELTNKLVSKLTDSKINLKTAVQELTKDFGQAENKSVTLGFAIARENIQNEIINQFDEAARGISVLENQSFHRVASKYPQLRGLNNVLQKVVNKESSVLVCNGDKTLRYCVDNLPDAFMAIGRCIASSFAYENIAQALSEDNGDLLNKAVDEYFTLEEVGKKTIEEPLINTFSASKTQCVPLVTTLRPKDIQYLNKFKTNFENGKALPKGFPVHGSMEVAYETAKVLQNMMGGWSADNIKIIDLSTIESAKSMVETLSDFDIAQNELQQPIVVVLKNWHIVGGNRAFQTDEKLGELANQWILSMNGWKNDKVVFVPHVPSEVPMSNVDFAMTREVRFGKLVETAPHKSFVGRVEPVEKIVMAQKDIVKEQEFCSRLYGNSEEKWPLHKLDRGEVVTRGIQNSVCQFLLKDKDSFGSIILSGLPGSGKGFVVEKAIFGFMKDYAKEHNLSEPKLVTIEQKDNMGDKIDQCNKILQESDGFLLVFPDEIDSRQNSEDVEKLTSFIDMCQKDYSDRVFIAGATNFMRKVNDNLAKRFRKEIYIDYLPEDACNQFIKIMTNLGKEGSKVSEGFDSNFVREVCEKVQVSPAIVDNTLKIAETNKEGKITPHSFAQALLSTMQLHKELHKGFKRGEEYLKNK